MQNLDNAELMTLRGQYATLNAAYKNDVQYLAKLTEKMITLYAQILTRAQPKDASSMDVIPSLEEAIILHHEIERSVACIADLWAQKVELQPRAWPQSGMHD